MNSLLHWLDIFAGYEIDFLLKKITIIIIAFQIEIAFTDIWIFLTPEGSGGGHLLLVENPILV